MKYLIFICLLGASKADFTCKCCRGTEMVMSEGRCDRRLGLIPPKFGVCVSERFDVVVTNAVATQAAAAFDPDVQAALASIIEAAIARSNLSPMDLTTAVNNGALFAALSTGFEQDPELLIDVGVNSAAIENELVDALDTLDPVTYVPCNSTCETIYSTTATFPNSASSSSTCTELDTGYLNCVDSCLGLKDLCKPICCPSANFGCLDVAYNCIKQACVSFLHTADANGCP